MINQTFLFPMLYLNCVRLKFLYAINEVSLRPVIFAMTAMVIKLHVPVFFGPAGIILEILS